MLGCARRGIEGPPRDCGEPARDERATPELPAGPYLNLCLNFHQVIPPLTIRKGYFAWPGPRPGSRRGLGEP